VIDFHFYTMNRADLVYAVCHLLGLRPQVAAATSSPSPQGGKGRGEGDGAVPVGTAR
jgi:hypothetical protein